MFRSVNTRKPALSTLKLQPLFSIDAARDLEHWHTSSFATVLQGSNIFLVARMELGVARTLLASNGRARTLESRREDPLFPNLLNVLRR